MQQYKVKPKILPNITEKIKNQISDLGFTEYNQVEKIIEKEHKHNFKILCQDKNNNKFIFKVRYYNNELFKHNFKNDFNNHYFFAIESRQKYFYTQKPIKWQLSDDFDWALYQYIEGRRLLSEQNQKNIHDKLIKIIYQIQNVPIHQVPGLTQKYALSHAKLFNQKISNQTSVYERLKTQVQGYFLNIEDNLPKKEIIKFIDDNKTLLNNEKQVLTHGDLTLHNIITTPQNIYLIDFENTQINYSTYDYVCLYNWAWDKPNWQKEFLKKSLSCQKDKNKFKILFRIMLILQFLYHMCYYSKGRQTLFYTTKKYYNFKKDNVLKALKNFDAL